MNKKNNNITENNPRRKSQTPKKKNKGKHKKKIIRLVIYITLVMFVLSLLCLLVFGIYKLSTSSKYVINNITFEGNVKYNNEDLREVLGISEGVNLFKVSKSEISKNLEALPYIQKVKISKDFPDTLEIKIIEHTSFFFAYNKETNKYVKLTAEGIILEECDIEAKEDNELIVFGINFDHELKGEIVEVEKKKLLNYIEIKEKYDKENIDKLITSIEFKEGKIILTLNHDINVIINNEDLSYRLNFLKKILAEIPGKAGSIDMTITNPIFRENIK